MKNYLKEFKKSMHKNEEQNARKTMIEELLIDMNTNRFTIYKVNFFRGVFFGFGSVLGGTILIAAMLWVLNVTGQLIPGVAGFVSDVTEVVTGESN